MDDVRRTDQTSNSPLMPASILGQAGWDVAQQFWVRSESVTKAMMDWNTEIFHFVSQRIARDSDTLGRMARCQAFPEVFEVEAQWFRDTVADYQTEANKLMEFGGKIFGSLTGNGYGAPHSVPAPAAGKVPAKINS